MADRPVTFRPCNESRIEKADRSLHCWLLPPLSLNRIIGLRSLELPRASSTNRPGNATLSILWVTHISYYAVE